jgi:hypothetical protein
MPIELPPSAISYLAAIGAIAIHIAQPPRVGVSDAVQLVRASRHLEWCAWTQKREAAERIANAPDLLWLRRTDRVKAIFPVAVIACKIEERAQATGVILTPRSRAIERAAKSAGRVKRR